MIGPYLLVAFSYPLSLYINPLLITIVIILIIEIILFVMFIFMFKYISMFIKNPFYIND